jgi:ethanolamine phosphate phosphodiesterase
LVDAPSLVEEERQREISGLPFSGWAAANPKGSIAFAQDSIEVARKLLWYCFESKLNVSAGSSGRPIVLLTHIPLHRSPNTSCGPFRERGTIRDGSGYGYENTLNSLASNMLLEGLRPSAVFRSVTSSTVKALVY